ncbi:SpoIIE family protein phosphatase [Streptomyces sp. 150FB]|uniref:SpoIIE family protein phosphatase n=1 Tax=Streptomyces sp. 150FB TaxID=1576605 RepID=UPI000A8F47CF|nr:SpoIIE family protein phosphatase [Streptomyces sp. 150FB]
MGEAGEGVREDEDENGVAAAEAAAHLDQLLDRTAYDVGAHIGAMYLQVPERQVLQMNTVTGAPRRLAAPWTRLAMATPGPVPEAVHSGTPVWLPDQQEMARRFPRGALAFPYSVAMYVVPLVLDGVSRGALMLMWPGSRPGLSAVEQERICTAADEMAEALRRADARGRPLLPRDEPLVMEPPPARHAEPAAALAERFTEGFVALDLRGRATYLTDRAVEWLGRDRVELLHAELWDALPWLSDPAYENAFVAALFSRQPTGFAARRPDGVWLSFLLYPDATGISVRVRPGDAPDSRQKPAEDTLPTVPARAGTLFHLLHLASALTEATGVSEVAESLMDQMRPALSAEGLALLVAEEGRLRVVGSRGFPPEMPEYFNGLTMSSQTEGIRTMETGVPGFHSTNAELVRAFPQHRHYREMTAFAFLPLTVSGGTFGCLVLGYDKPRPFPPDERAELTSLAGMIAQAMERARLYDANAQVARGLQDGLLPRGLPRVPGLAVAARYRPATHALEVGGDFYDLIDLGADGAAAVIGDVQGHNVQAAALMGQIRTTVHSHARTGAPPEQVLARTNQLLLELNTSLFCSCLYACIDVPGHSVALTSAGHPPPILRHPSGRTEVLDLPPGLLLGVQEEACFETVEAPLPPGALLALYTDGLVERPGTDLGLSIDLLADQLAEAQDEPLDMLADRIVKRAEETVVPRSSDDIALLLVRRDMAGKVQSVGAGSAGSAGSTDGRTAG